MPDKPHDRGPNNPADSSFQPEDFGHAGLGEKAKSLGGAPVAEVPTFDEFERPAPKESDGWAQTEGTGPPNPGDGEPSLGYLFTPFDPGKIEEAEFREEFKDTPQPENYEYVEMDTRDTGIVKTLEMANKKAAEIVSGAFEQGRRLEANLLETAKAEAQEIEKAAREQAAAIEAEGQKNAQVQAEAIVNEAKAKVAEMEAKAAETDRLKSETEALKTQADEVLVGVLAREAALAPREAEIDQIRADIENQRRQILEQARKEAEEAKAKANAQGLDEGRAKGQEMGALQAKNEILTKAKGFFQIVSRIDGIWHELWKRNAPSMVALAVDAAEAIVNKEIENGQGLAAGAFSACVDYLSKCNAATFRVRPEDMAEIEEARKALRDKVDGVVNVTFKPDPSLGPGDIVMESDAGLLDATVKNRRERVMAVLRQAIADGLVAELPPEIPQDPGPDPAQAQAPDQEPDPVEPTGLEAQAPDQVPDPAESIGLVAQAPDSAPDPAEPSQESAQEPPTPATPETAPAASEPSPETPA
ncbi:MAG: hypothetical protein LBJ61_07270 [Deltaproteobacteria bacterium]|nr:hypothetical protein [Deltaproteobacteria bacterium]